MIYVECSPDEVLVRTITRLSRKDVVHELKGKPAVAYQISRRKNCRGLLDEDPLSTQPRYLETLKVARDTPAQGLRLLEDRVNSNLIILLCPRLEEWVIRASQDAGVDLRRYNLPSDANTLHRIINIDISQDASRFGRLIRDLRNTDRLVSLTKLLNL